METVDIYDGSAEYLRGLTMDKEALTKVWVYA